MTDKRLLEQALDALKSMKETLAEHDEPTTFNEDEAITAIRARLEQPEQERNFCERCGKRLGGEGHIHTCTPPAAPVQEPVKVWEAEGYDALMQEMQMVKARNIRQHAEIERLTALVRAQQITIDKLEKNT